MKPMFYEQMSQMRCSCNGPNCSHVRDGLFMNQRCHVNAGVNFRVENGIMFVRCAECGKAVVNLAVQTPKTPVKLACHPNGPMEVCYKQGTAIVTCKQCGKEAGVLNVRREAAAR